MSYRVLLVCMGNICRSPTAEGVLRHFIKINGLGDKVEVEMTPYDLTKGRISFRLREEKTNAA